MSASMKLVLLSLAGLTFVIGFATGGFMFYGVQERNFISPPPCESSCLNESRLLGLVGSVVMQKAPFLLPKVVYETDKNVAIVAPNPQADLHYVIIPKRDIKHIGDLTAEDAAYLADAFAVIRLIIEKDGLRKYKILSNGPGYQEVNYLHFHLFGPNP